MILDMWRTREDLQMRLDATLREDHVVDALSVLTQMGLPTGDVISDINVNALTNSYREGYFRCLANLLSLRNVKKVEVRPMPAPWQKKRGDVPE